MTQSTQTTQTTQTTRHALYVAEILALWALDRIRRRPTDIDVKAGPADYVTDTDREIEQHIRAELNRHFPEHAVNGEEFGDGGSHFTTNADGVSARPTWFIDPVDGTTNYAHDLPWHSFSLGLHDAAGPLVAVVADAGRGEIISAARGLGARRDGLPIQASSAIDPTGAVVLTELAATAPWPGQSAFLHRMTRREITMRIMGSSALSLATVGTGRIAAAALGGGYGMWDVAAGALIAREAGARLFAHNGTEAGPADPPPLGGLLAVAPGIADALREDLLAAIAAEG
ncbi:MAG TPA: inositol monophosphatase family protein [Actinospica sp.]|nr:inositol monophosphatase family protein [Actinospica sp.]